MSRIALFTANGSNGFQLSQEVMDMLQTELQDIIKSFICVVGNEVIFCGVTGPTGGSIYSDGLVSWNNEFFYFEGGAFAQYLVVNEQRVQLTVCDNNAYDAYVVRTLRFQNTVDLGDTFVEVTNVDGLGVFTRVDTIATLTQNYATLAQTVTDNYTDLSNQITNLTTVVNNNALTDNSEIGDVKYIKDISQFDVSGLGNVGTTREGWALVTDANAQWKTALGFGGTFNDIDGRTLVIAGTKYSVLNQFGVDSVALTESEMPSHDHDYSGSSSTNGSHIHEATEITGVGTANRVISFESVPNSPGTGGSDSETIQPAGDHSHTFSGTTDPKGSGTAHENRQPSIALYMAVKYQ